MDAPPDSHINHSAALEYWNTIPATANGMLGGYASISSIDLRSSRVFLTKARRLASASASASASSPSTRQPESQSEPNSPQKPITLALECGAGIGRITSGLLAPLAHRIDIVEPVSKFTDTLVTNITSTRGSPSPSVLGDVYNVGLEAFEPPAHKQGQYELIWAQWCLGHLTDAQTVEFLRLCGRLLSETKEGSVLVVKENNVNVNTAAGAGGNASGAGGGLGEDLYDEQDSSVTRTDEKWRALFREAGLDLILTELQRGFPRDLGLLPVRSYALRPRRGS